MQTFPFAASVKEQEFVGSQQNVQILLPRTGFPFVVGRHRVDEGLSQIPFRICRRSTQQQLIGPINSLHIRRAFCVEPLRQ